MLAAPRCAVLSLADENFNLFLTPWEPGGAGSRVSTHYNLPQLETKLRKVFTITVKAASTRDLSWLKAATGIAMNLGIGLPMYVPYTFVSSSQFKIYLPLTVG